MSNEEEYRVIFFPHPYIEHNVKKNARRKEWNAQPKHRRKFLVANGTYIDKTKTKHENEKLFFWGEWESESDYKPLTKNDPSMPFAIHEPKCFQDEIFNELSQGKRPKRKECIDFFSGKQNTDPYVFGEQFMYSCCKQTGTNPLKDLNKGDIIIFYGQTGKKKTNNYKCHIDTVFVVGGVVGRGNYEDILGNLISHEKVSTQFIYKVIFPIIFGNQNSLGSKTAKNEFVLYYGATFEAPVNDMFSFVLCNKKPYDNGFKRYECDPFLKHDAKKGDIVDTKCYPDNNVSVNTYTREDIRTFWKKLTNDILEQGYQLGTKADEPAPEQRID